CADAPRVAQVLAARYLVVADEQRTEVPLAGALARQPAAHHQLLPSAHLELEPRARPATDRVAAAEPLGDQALHAPLAHHFEQLLAATDPAVADLPVVRRGDQLEQPLPARLVGQSGQVFAVDLEHVE